MSPRGTRPPRWRSRHLGHSGHHQGDAVAQAADGARLASVGRGVGPGADVEHDVHARGVSGSHARDQGVAGKRSLRALAAAVDRFGQPRAAGRWRRRWPSRRRRLHSTSAATVRFRTIFILQLRQIHLVHAAECGRAGSRPALLVSQQHAQLAAVSFTLTMVERRDARILVVDDDEQLAALLVLVLEGEGYPVTVASDAAGAIDEVKKGRRTWSCWTSPSVRTTAAWCCRRSGSSGELPVILISGKGDTADRVLGLRLGADDYLPKPFSPVELVARVESVLRRVGRAPAPAHGQPERRPTRVSRWTSGPVRCAWTASRSNSRPRSSTCWRSWCARPARCSAGASCSSTCGRPAPEWQDEATVTEHVRRVRHKVEADPEHPRWITTVRGVGYRFEP